MAARRHAVFGVMLVLAFLTMASFVGCAKKMSDDDNIKISKEYLYAVAGKGFGLLAMTDEEREREGRRMLDEACKKYGYSTRDYMHKLKQMNKKYPSPMNPMMQ